MVSSSYIVTTREGKVIERTNTGKKDASGKPITRDRELTPYEVTLKTGEKVQRASKSSGGKTTVIDFAPATLPKAEEKKGVAVSKYEVTTASGEKVQRQYTRVGGKITVTDTRSVQPSGADVLNYLDAVNVQLEKIPARKTSAAVQVPSFEGDIKPKGMDWWTNLNYEAGKTVIESPKYQEYKSDFSTGLERGAGKSGWTFSEFQAKLFGRKYVEKAEPVFIGFQKGAVAQVVERPLETGALFAAGGALGAAGKAVSFTKYGALGVKTLGSIGLGFYGGSIIAKTIQTPGGFQKGKFLGGEAVRAASFTLGAQIGSSLVKPPEPSFVRGTISEAKTISGDDQFVSSARYRTQFKSGNKLIDVEGVGTERGILGKDNVYFTRQEGAFQASVNKQSFWGKLTGRGFAGNENALNFEKVSVFGKGGKLVSSFQTIDTSQARVLYEVEGLKTYGIKGARFTPDLGKISQFYGGTSKELAVFESSGRQVTLFDTAELGVTGKYVDVYASGFKYNPSARIAQTGISLKTFQVQGKAGSLFAGAQSFNAGTPGQVNILESVSVQKPVAGLSLRVLSQSKMIASSLVQVKNPLLVGSLPVTRTATRNKSIQLPALAMGTASTTKTFNIQRTGLNLGSLSRVSITQLQRQSSLQRTGLRQSQLIRQDVVQRSELISPLRPVFALPVQAPPARIGFAKRGLLQGYGRKEFKSYFISFRPKYVASVEAVVFNIRGKANLRSAFTGIGLRPIRLGG